MKTVNINLTDKSAEKSGLKKIKNFSGDIRKQLSAYLILMCILVVFAASFGGYILVKKMKSNLNKDITSLNKNIETLKEEESRLSKFKDDLKKEKEEAEYKILISDKINGFFIPWSGILKEISSKIPKDIIILKIEKLNVSEKESQTDGSQKLKISGIISAKKKKEEPLTLISLFIFNLNENPNSLLSKAKILKIEFAENSKTYEFEIETSLTEKSQKFKDGKKDERK